MTDEAFSSPKPSPSQPASKKCGRKKCALLIFLILIGITAIAFRLSPFYARIMLASQPQAGSEIFAQIDQRLTGLENSVRALDERISALTTVAVDQTGATSVSSPPKQPSTDIARMQSDLVALSSALAALQSQVKESETHSQHSQAATQGTLAAAMAFLQLRLKAESSAVFVAEAATLREAAAHDTEIQASLGRIQPLAATGVPTITQLREQFLSLEASMQNAVEKQQANNWWQRFTVTLKGLVSIRRLHDNEGGGFAAIEKDLDTGDLAAALQDVAALPAEAQNVLKDWREKAMARKLLDSALQDMGDHLNAVMKPEQEKP